MGKEVVGCGLEADMRSPARWLATIVVLWTTMFTLPAGAQGEARSGGRMESSATALKVSTREGVVAQTRVVHRVFDAKGNLLDTRSETRKNPDVRVQQSGFAFQCRHEGKRAGFSAHAPWESLFQGENDFVQGLFFPYEQQQAREVGPPQRRYLSNQWVICGVGGADGDNGSRITRAGPGVAYKDQKATFKIGQVWREGKTPENYSVTLGFSTEGPVKVSGGITQTPHHSLKGSPRPPHDDDEMDRLARNGANGWWEHSCVPDCGGNGSPTGVSSFQGSVVEGLWEFHPDRAIQAGDFLMKMYWTHHCANFFGRCEE